MGGKSLATYLFFESVPDEFFDKLPSQWYFNPEDKFVPIILSRDYLTLYNFGFAMPQGLPQVSEEVIGMVPITLTITGKQQTTEQFEAAIVGFSSRLNTIAVPQEFMDWANKRYNDSVATEAPKTTRLIVKTDKFDGEEMKQYLQKEEIERYRQHIGFLICCVGCCHIKWCGHQFVGSVYFIAVHLPPLAKKQTNIAQPHAFRLFSKRNRQTLRSVGNHGKCRNNNCGYYRHLGFAHLLDFKTL